MSQSILGRVFDYGTLTIRGTGETIEALRNIASPLHSIPTPPEHSFSAGLSRLSIEQLRSANACTAASDKRHTAGVRAAPNNHGDGDRRALELGCMFSINPDAHSIDELDLAHHR
jgi:hypothetical protein